MSCRHLRFVPLLFAGLAALTVRPRAAQAVIVERVVAVVGDRPVLLSELRRRAKPNLIAMFLSVPDPSKQAAGENEVYRDALNRMIDEQLVEQAAQKGHLAVSVDEIDRAIVQKAGQLGIGIADLVAEAKREGLSEQDYRDEIRRQILEGKLVQLRVAGRVRVTESDAREAYARFSKDFVAQSPVEIRSLPMKLTPIASAIEAKEKLAQEIVLKARAGGDFCALVKDFSDDVQSRDQCGLRGRQPLRGLYPAIQEQLADMKDGDVSNPIRFGQDVILVFQLVRRGKLPTFDAVRAQMMDLAVEDLFQRQRDLYLQELRRGIYIDIRLNS